MGDKNMSLWGQVCVTDPAQTKEFTKGNFTGTDICPQARRKRATEVFGPFGINWGVSDSEYRFQPTEKGQFVFYTGRLWFRFDGNEGVFDISSSDHITKDYEKNDSDFAKVLMTDATTKGLSFLGFNSDVFEGRFDDSKYRASLVKDGDDLKPQNKHISEMLLLAPKGTAVLNAYWRDLGKEACAVLTSDYPDEIVRIRELANSLEEE